MYIIGNAFKSIIRSKGRNILVGIIVLSIAISSCVALSIKYAAEEAEIQGIEQLNITATISLDTEKLIREAQESNNGSGNRDQMRTIMQAQRPLSLDEMLTYSESDYINDFYYAGSTSINANGSLEAVSSEESTDTNQENASGENGNGGMAQPGGPDGGGGGRRIMMMGGMSMGDFTITGYSSENAMTNFLNGTSQITDGEMFDTASEDFNCIISNELAIFNSLKVGDKIKFENPNDETQTYEFKITGIYSNTTTDTDNNMPMFSTAMDPANLICVSSDALKSIIDKSASLSKTETDENGREYETKLSTQDTGTYVFSSIENFEKFSEEVKAKGLSDNYKVTSNDMNNFEESLAPLKNLNQFATTLLLIILGIGAIILIVINIFNIRERKFEVGVLTAIGIKKGKVTMQFIIEFLTVTLIAIIIGAGIGAVVSVPIANNLLESQVSAQEEKEEEQMQNFGRGGMAIGGGPAVGNAIFQMRGIGGQNQDVNYLDQINATINFNIILQLIGIGIILTFISSLAGIIFVLRYEPLKILANRT